VEESELTVFSQNITQYFESCFVDVEVGIDCEHSVGSDYEWDLSEVRNVIMSGLRLLARKGEE